jgi:hypothetical protein
MYLFKTSGQTFESVIGNQKHAFRSRPTSWHPKEIVLVSKNRNDCIEGEKQIQYTMRLNNIRTTTDIEIEQYWPGNPGRWKFIVDCTSTEPVPVPFDLVDILGGDAETYRYVVTFMKIQADHEQKILSHLNQKNMNNTDEITSLRDHVEGSCRTITVNAYERDPSARQACVKHYGYFCQVCDFNFEKQYGGLGAGFIHVHHTVPLSQIKKEYKVDPIKDLIPLCANCHSLIHRRSPILTVDELKDIVIGKN